MKLIPSTITGADCISFFKYPSVREAPVKEFGYIFTFADGISQNRFRDPDSSETVVIGAYDTDETAFPSKIVSVYGRKRTKLDK